MSKGSILQVNNVYLLNSYRIPSDPALSDIFRLSDLTVGNRRIRHPTTSDRILSEVVGLCGVSCSIRWDPTVGFLVLGRRFRQEANRYGGTIAMFIGNFYKSFGFDRFWKTLWTHLFFGLGFFCFYIYRCEIPGFMGLDDDDDSDFSPTCAWLCVYS